MLDSIVKITTQEPGNCEVHHVERVDESYEAFGIRFKSYRCPACAQLVQAEEDRLERERAANAYRQAQDRSGVPPRFRDASLDGVIAETPAQQDVLATLRQFAESRGREPNALILAGRMGTGKTYAGYALVNEWLRGKHACLFTTAIGLIRRIRATWKSEQPDSEAEVVKRLATYALLVIDEVGVQTGTPNELALLADVLNQRYEQLRPTVVIGNLTMDEFAIALGERAMDRFREGGKVLSFTWESRRWKN
jgi:DNA replication protein DnaC